MCYTVYTPFTDPLTFVEDLYKAGEKCKLTLVIQKVHGPKLFKTPFVGRSISEGELVLSRDS